MVIGQLTTHETNWRRVSKNNNISQLLGDSFSVSQQPPSWDPCSHYSMTTGLLLKCVEKNKEYTLNHDCSELLSVNWIYKYYTLMSLINFLHR